MSSQPQLRPEDIGVVVRALANWACSGRPIDSLDLINEVDTALGLVARTYSDGASPDCLAAARALLVSNQPLGALVKLEGLLARRHGYFTRSR
jgi:hypothetical protein